MQSTYLKIPTIQPSCPGKTTSLTFCYRCSLKNCPSSKHSLKTTKRYTSFHQFQFCQKQKKKQNEHNTNATSAQFINKYLVILNPKLHLHKTAANHFLDPGLVFTAKFDILISA